MMAQSKANGSHYALTAIGLGMLVLGVIMAMWNLVPGFSAAEKPTAQGNNKTEIGSGILKSKTFSVAYVLVGAGVMLLLLSICLSIRDKRKQRQGEEMAHIQHQAGAEPHAPEEDSQEEEEEASSRYYVPSYEEVMNTDYSEAREPDQNPRMSISLPSYESLTGLDESSPTAARANAETGAGNPPDRQNSKLAKRLKPLKVRRIKSEKLHLKDFRINLPDKNAPAPSIEPLTPPPQYDEVHEKPSDARPPD
ncbi:transmembrane protein 51 [Prionailurus viverrinus]|uniref:Transmembrane protein 51 isoform X1 n=1 Tax=Puma concolor TaxID=9696 RepID=A0A6P6GXE9_PUMCO|nr:transmembrane protein 51 isoform X1 [Puma concolor]XP_040317852.1 transmembrane protein 51 isoform X1 [Puma yagouaroundi]XP_047727329.1 transmembrane protein 51 [Prionailurus viverrinus]XP_047727330.1 transmembrane protein 51 [Prionailurus viverrinus]XP_047727332.1 transmembrane protein 51 [Prionailurus viverrinus]XP_047727333.1 transmembrane protein 51 [Prionailurus viverrinus]XP_047727334.1 transmembrane protein 51 [Prionailurus viverrinus]XP_047727335.1 transmembrane protein 51 [Priona